MNKNENNSPFSFLPKEALITYKKVPLIIPTSEKLQNQIIAKNNKSIFIY